MTNIKEITQKDGSKLEIPKYTLANERNEFIVDINDPLSMASVLKYQIEHWDEKQIRDLARSGQKSVDYGYLDDEGEFESYEGFEDIPADWNSDYFYYFSNFYYDELVFAKAATSHPELWPLLEEYGKLLVEASRNEKTGGPWATEETILGQFLLFELADCDKKYIYLAEDFSCNVEVRCSTNFREEYLYSISKLYKKWGLEDNFISVAEAVCDSELDEEIDYTQLFDAMLEDDDLSDDTLKAVKEFVRLQDRFQDKFILPENELLSFYATDAIYDSSFIIKNKQRYVSMILDTKKRTCTISIPSETVELSLSDDFYDLAEDVFDEIL